MAFKSFVAHSIIIVQKRINHSKSAGKERCEEIMFYENKDTAEYLFNDWKKDLDFLCTHKNYSGEVIIFHPVIDEKTGEIIKNIKNEKNVLIRYCNAN